VLTRPTPEVPGPGQLSAWDFPRPPAYVQWHERVEIRFGGSVVASTTEAWCVLETSHPPTYYLPRSAFVTGSLRQADGSSHCEWKGQAVYYDVVAGEQVAPRAAWSYPAADNDAEVIRDHVAVYPALMDSCTVDGEVVTPQPGGFYGGWVTSRIVGPFKGGPGTQGW
jgi:uncharacterized protein (DUF427 family)